MMRATSPGAIAASTALHAAVAAALVVAALAASRGVRKPDTELVVVPDVDIAVPGPGRRSDAGLQGGPMVDYRPSTVPRERIPDPVPDAGTAQPEPKGAPNAGPVPDRGARQQRTNWDSFARQHGLTQQLAQRGATTARPVPQVDGARMVDELMRLAAGRPGGGPEGTAVDPAAQADFFVRLVGLLKAAHVMPASVDRLYTAGVAFVVARDGSISKVRVISPSGSADYDRSVLAAFGKVGALGPVPEGCEGGCEIEFTMAD